MDFIPPKSRPIGYLYLIECYKLVVLPHFRASYVIPTWQQIIIKNDNQEVYVYPKSYMLSDMQDSFQHLEFAFKHEGINLEILKNLFDHISSQQITAYLGKASTGKYSRIMWYLYEWLTGKKLMIDDLVASGSYVNLLDEEMYYTTKPIKIRRQRVNDNLLGDSSFCPLVRRTSTLVSYETKQLDSVGLNLLKKYDVLTIERAMQYLYTKETMSSYQIEREQPDKARLARFTQILEQSSRLKNMDKNVLIELQNAIVDSRFAEENYRTSQNYIGENTYLESQRIHYVSPQPQDVATLMQGLIASLEHMIASGVHPVIIATTIAFGFVFIHPFEDGNGRLHRFLIHYVLAITRFVPEGMIFPVSAVILKNRKKYDEVLEGFSIPLLSTIENYQTDMEGNLTAKGNVSSLYQYIDYTRFAEYLFECIEQTIDTDFKQELEYLVNYDSAKKQIQDTIDMPDKLIGLFINFVKQNKGKLSVDKRLKFFNNLTDEEIQTLEKIVQETVLR